MPAPEPLHGENCQQLTRTKCSIDHVESDLDPASRHQPEMGACETQVLGNHRLREESDISEVHLGFPLLVRVTKSQLGQSET
jgi:hypothetical protein